MTINSGTTGTLSPQVIVKFDLGKELAVIGELHAVGSGTDSVIFTSVQDDGYGGDSNGDGNATVPAPGNWQRIRFVGARSNSSILRRCAILYGGSGGTGNVYCQSDYMGSANTTIENCRIAFSSNYGIYVGDSNPVIGGNTISFNTSVSLGYPIYLGGTCSPSFSSPNNLLNNKFPAIGVDG